MLEEFNNIMWVVDRSLDSAVFRNENGEFLPITDEMWNRKLSVPNDYQLSILDEINNVYMSIPLSHKSDWTVKDVLELLKEYLQKPLIPRYDHYWRHHNHSKNYIYYMIWRHADATYMRRLHQMWVDGELTILELMGDYKYFEGMRAMATSEGRYLIPIYGS